MKRLGVLFLAIPAFFLSACAPNNTNSQQDAASWMIAMNGDFTTEFIDGRFLLLMDSPTDTKLFTERPGRSALPVTPETVVAMWPMFGFSEVPPNSAVMVDGQAPQIDTLNNPAWTSQNAIRIEMTNNDIFAMSGSGSIVIDASNPVNGEVTDAVTIANTKIVGDAPAQAMGSLYQTIGNSIAMAAANDAYAQQQENAPIDVTANDQGVIQILKITGGQGNPGAQTPTN